MFRLTLAELSDLLEGAGGMDSRRFERRSDQMRSRAQRRVRISSILRLVLVILTGVSFYWGVLAKPAPDVWLSLVLAIVLSGMALDIYSRRQIAAVEEFVRSAQKLEKLPLGFVSFKALPETYLVIFARVDGSLESFFCSEGELRAKINAVAEGRYILPAFSAGVGEVEHLQFPLLQPGLDILLDRAGVSPQKVVSVSRLSKTLGDLLTRQAEVIRRN